ncbi:MAG: 30S ribosomal protein S4 [Candidatus Nanopusillus sp.]|nr:30S ribosomal protein S4 [Candidatus Nanopusillus sp.]MCG2868617.1 30S ribosomal protein S4 [Candidatus Nanopusillus sp.]
MWRNRKTWEGPTHPWQKDRIEEERQLLKQYGLKNKREIWKAATIARKIRFYVRYLNAKKAAGVDVSKEEEKLKNRLVKFGLLNKNSDISEALNITVREILERRLQTIVFRKGLAKTIKQARQLIVHRHIVIGDKVISSPGYLVKVDEEDKIGYNPYSNINKEKLFGQNINKEENKESTVQEVNQPSQ